MAGTILSNFWGALFGFSIYFFSSFPFLNATKILTGATIAAVFLFFLTFLIRAIIAFFIEQSEVVEEAVLTDEIKTTEQQAPSSEQYADAVKSMLNEDEE
ncbi:hypothetical protein [Psychrobacillus sp.]|uniref:hypothetical protein n=1 Tax=Psychrobacillus sp. TaxID=1871623 RepID=UPI0028BD8632|nr:hypothetical protein [Psychrobacillus sp.]